MAKIIKPTRAEKKIIDKRLRKQYPQMFEKNWAKSLKKKVKKEFKTARTSDIENKLRRAGLSEKEIARLRGKK